MPEDGDGQAEKAGSVKEQNRRLGMPERVMSFTELVALGYSRAQLKTYCREEDFPGIKTPGGGKWLVYVEQLPAWIEKYNRRNNIRSEAVKRMKRRQMHGRRRLA